MLAKNRQTLRSDSCDVSQYICRKLHKYDAKGVARLQFKRRQSGQVIVEVPKAPRGVGCAKGTPPQKIFVLFDLKMEHFGAVFKLDLTEETRKQLQEEEAIAYAYV